MARRGDDRLRGAFLDDAPRVHDCDAVGDRRDDREVVRDVDQGDGALALKAPELRQDARLRDDVETRGRLVEHHERRIADERERDREPLLLAARELVREAALEGAVGRKVDALEDACDALVHALLEGVGPQHLAHVIADPDGRVQCRSRILRHVRHEPPAERAQLMRLPAGDLLAADANAPGLDAEPGPRVAEQSLGDGRLAAARLSDHTEDLAGGDVERDVLHDRTPPDVRPAVP